MATFVNCNHCKGLEQLLTVSPDKAKAQVICEACGCSGPVATSKEEAIEQWNALMTPVAFQEKAYSLFQKLEASGYQVRGVLMSKSNASPAIPYTHAVLSTEGYMGWYSQQAWDDTLLTL